MNKIRTFLTILLVPALLIATLVSCSATAQTPEPVPTTNISTEANVTESDLTSANIPTEVNTTGGGLPYVFEGIIKLGVVNAPPAEVTMDIEMPAFPDGLMVYKVVRPVVDDSYAAQCALRFGFSGEPLPSIGERMVYTYLSGDDSLEIGLDGSVTLLRALTSNPLGTVPTPDACINIASDFLASMDFYPGHVIAIETAPYLEADGQVLALGVMFTLGIEDFALNGVGAFVAVGQGGNILKATINALNVEPDSVIKLKSAETALAILKAFLASSSGNPPEAKECLTNWRAFDYLHITGVSLQYHYFQGDYLLPKYIFTGEASYKTHAATEKFRGQVDAILR
jgi:hypothetical protein